MTSPTRAPVLTPGSIPAPRTEVRVPTRPRPVSERERRVRHSARRAVEARYTLRLRVTDAVVVLAAVLSGYVVDVRSAEVDATGLRMLNTGQVVVAVLLVMLWLVALELAGSHRADVLGHRAEELRAVVGATLRTGGVLAVLALLLKLEVVRGHVLVALPVGLVGLCLGRLFWTRRARTWREAGRWRSRVLIVAPPRLAGPTVRRFTEDVGAGIDVVGMVWPGHAVTPGETMHGVPVVGDEHDVARGVSARDADTVVVMSNDELDHEWLTTLSWELDGTGTDLVVAPSVADVAGPRMRLRLVSGLPLMRIDQPRYEGATRAGKGTFDLVVALCAMALLGPGLLLVALAVRVTSPGPVLFRQERVGLDGRPFTMLKFRSMTDGADKHLAGLLEAQGTAQSPLFKLDHDPRVTRVGALLRKYSLDELPQLVNVLRGEMSLVGPRPQRPAEVALYTGGDHHRLRVRPGLTGLWQVSGRSALTWEQTIRLDRYYVENWSFVTDLVLLGKTVRVVLLGTGAW